MSKYKFLFKFRSGIVCVVMHKIRKGRAGAFFCSWYQICSCSSWERAFLKKEGHALFCLMLAHGPANFSCRLFLTFSQWNVCFQTAEGGAKLGIRVGIADFWYFGKATLSLKYFLSFCSRRGYICLTLTWEKRGLVPAID